MKVKHYFKFRNTLENEEKAKLLKQQGKKRYEKGNLIMPPNSVSIGWDGNDFRDNMSTVLLESKAYRVPRILNKICN